MSSSSKYYVVWQGRQPGIYTSWQACAAQVQGYPNARFKAYPTRDIAERAYRLGPKAAQMPIWVLAQPGPQVPAIAVDAAASQARGPVEYQGVMLEPQGKTRRLFLNRLPYATVPLGEFVALVRALQWMENRNARLPVYTDARTAFLWFQKGGPGEKTLKRLPPDARRPIMEAMAWLQKHPGPWDVRLWDTARWGENPADFGRKR